MFTFRHKSHLSLIRLRYHISVFPIIICLLYLGLALSSIQQDDITYDESDHLNYGIAIWKGSSQRTAAGRDFNTTMPVTAINALPRAVEQVFHPGLHKSDWGESDIRSGRYITIFFTLILLIYAYLFGESIAGKWAGLWSMGLLALDPNLLAHSRLVTTDLYATLSFFAVLYHLYEWRAKGNRKHFYYWCIAIALAICCKINNILLYPLSLCVIFLFSRPGAETRQRRFGQIKDLVAFVLIQLLVINSCFLWQETGQSLDQHSFKSSFFQQTSLGWIGSLPLPLPFSFIQTFDLAQYERESFAGTAMNYLMGELRYKEGFWNYYIICWIFKTPVFTQLLAMAAFAYFIFKKSWRKTALAFWIIPSLTICVFLSMSSVQSGYRYLLPMVTITLLFCGVYIAIAIAACRKRWMPILAAALVVAPAAMGFPNYIAFTNLLIPNKTNNYRWFADSNIDWGQRDKKVVQFIRSHPGYQLEPRGPAKGMIVVGVNKFTGTVEPGAFEWLRKSYSPIGNFEKCYLIFRVDDNSPPKVTLPVKDQ